MDNKKIVVLGIGKSGTTALFHAIRESVPEEYVKIFEPNHLFQIKEQCTNSSGMVSKILVSSNSIFIMALPLLSQYIGNYFSHTVLIVRDPRDIFVSGFLYTGGYGITWKKEIEEILKVYQLLCQKEKAPSSLSMLKMMQSLPVYKSTYQIELHLSCMIGLSMLHNVHVMKYEDFVENKLDGLSNYLGITINGNVQVPEYHQRVTRTRSFGSWRHWFTEEDCEYLKIVSKPFMEHFGYNYEDWQLSPDPVISPEHCSQYFLRIVNERRRIADLEEVMFP